MRVAFLMFVIVCFSGTSGYAQTAPNVTDAENLKQGQWNIFGKDQKLPGYGPEQLVEKGFYKDGRKEGKWTKYYNNGRVEHELTFKYNKLEGHAIFYYRNGKKKEEGDWKKNRWVGDYKYYYKNGNVRNDWKYNVTGKRTGVQRYYHENGQVKLEGAWENGKESGTLVEYFEDGSIKSERFFANGKMDQVKTKNYAKAEKPKPGTEKPVDSQIKEPVDSASAEVEKIVVKKVEKTEKKPFDGNGFNEFYNKEGVLIRKGMFKNGYLDSGELYKYAPSGKLIKTYYYKGGKIVRVKNH